MASIHDRILTGKHDIVGSSYICLDPRRFGDLLTHDLWMDLDSKGRKLLRVGMEGEKDKIGFYFGRAFRSLKRAGSDLVKIFVDRVGFIIMNGGRNTYPATSPDVSDDIPVAFSECGQVLNQADHEHGIAGLQPSSGKRQRILCIRPQRFTEAHTPPLPSERPRIRRGIDRR